MDWALLLRLLTAHFIADFFFQPDSWAKDKAEKGFTSVYLYLHAIVVMVITFLLVWNPGLWLLSLVIGVIHLIVDGVRAEFFDDTATALLIDQVIHILIIILLWLVFANQASRFLNLLVRAGHSVRLWAYLLGFIVVTTPSSIVIAKVTHRWSKQIKEDNKDSGLERAGRWIGILERVLILASILSNRWEVIGFLLGAKSIFRFGDLRRSKDQQKTEYIIIGTLLSFAIAIFVGLTLEVLFT